MITSSLQESASHPPSLGKCNLGSEGSKCKFVFWTSWNNLPTWKCVQNFVFLRTFRKHSSKSPPIELKITKLHTLRHFLIIWCEALSFRVPRVKMIGPPARLTLRPKSVFLKEVSGTPAKTALVSSSPWKDLAISVVKSEIGRKVSRPRAKNWKVTRTKWSFFGQKSTFRKSVQIDPKVLYLSRKCPRVCNLVILSSIGGLLLCFLKTQKITNFERRVSF